MKKDTEHSISEWEQAIANRNDIEIIEILLQDGGVTGVRGFILIRGHRRSVSWSSDGYCYFNGRRATSYDIKF